MTTPIEKAAEARYPEGEWSQPGTLLVVREAFIAGAEWQRTQALTAALGSVEETARVLADADSHTLAPHDKRCAFCTGYRNQAEALHAHLLGVPETKEAGS